MDCVIISHKQNSASNSNDFSAVDTFSILDMKT